MSFAEMLRALRTDKGWTQEELSDKSGVPLWTLRSYETGKREAGWRSLLDLCKVLGVDPRVFDPCVPGEPTTTQRGRPRQTGTATEKPSTAPGELPAPQRKPKARKTRKPRGG